MRAVTWVVILVFSIAGFQIATDITTVRTTGTVEKICSNVTNAAQATAKNFTIACGEVTFTMIRRGEWTPEFRRLSNSALAQLYNDRPFQCRYEYVMVDTWYRKPMLTETYRDCHQVQGEYPGALRLRRSIFT